MQENEFTYIILHTVRIIKIGQKKTQQSSSTRLFTFHLSQVFTLEGIDITNATFW